MDVLVASHTSSLLHDTGPRHPERPQRVEAVLRGIRDSNADISEVDAPKAERSELALVHDASYIEMIETFCQLGGGALDMDTFASPESWEASLTAVGGVRVLLEELETQKDALGFAVSRPPGHHAMPDRAMGFCLFNNVAVAAAVARSRGARVAILDWDVHHGNGTQAMFMDDPGTLYVSIHQANFYPFAGAVDDIDAGEAKGTTVNVPLPAGTAGDVYRRAWSDIVIPVTTQFQPDWVFVSAGYDAHHDDVLANIHLMSGDYGWMSAGLAAIHPLGRTIVALEGGYDLDAIRESVRATVDGFAGDFVVEDGGVTSPEISWQALANAAEHVGRHWSL